MSFDEWLADGDVPEVDWTGHLNKLALRGDLGRLGRRWLLDWPALTQPYACRSGECTPGARAPRIKSCCADLGVDVTDTERKAIADGLADVAAHLAPLDERWAERAPRWLDQGELTRPGGRCVFARPSAEGLRCGLREVEGATGRARGAIQPLPCRLFPLVVVDLGDGRRFLTAVHTRTARRLGHPTAKAFPCLREGREPLYVGCRDTVEELFGKPTWRSLDQAARAWLG